MPRDTYYFASVTGDRAFIEWIWTRLKEVHGENELMDYMHTLKKFAEAGEIIDRILLRQARKENGL